MFKPCMVIVASFLLISCAQAQSDDHILTACQQWQPVNMAQYAKNNVKQYSGRIVKISDGDTVQIQDTHGQKHRVRLAFIDAPEMRQAAGKESFKNLQNMLSRQKTVQVQVTDIDQYQRQVAIVWQGDVDVNASQLAQGLAWHYDSIAKKQQQVDAYRYYQCLHQQAQKQRVGLWRNHQAQAPWAFRQSERAQ
ncbi:nuclease [Vitreoscilla sp. C1]|uniref:thermonuclease family protein n=1 Tax=Vitreoscilla sp. (strain C1) TaxID=96942 RepID=UPI00148EC39F|nr:thermonuclease family protein [Vitreoscilla sp. C1]AUZ05761.2 nuclease [Vitreoscilla sp. C1]